MTGRRIIGAALALIAAYHAVQAAASNFHGLHGGLHGRLALLAAICAVLVARAPAPWVTRAPNTARRTRGRWLAMAGGAAVLAWYFLGPWTPRADFDVTGFLHVVQNIVPLGVLAVLVLITAGGILMWKEL